ncbi:MAG: ribosomal protein S18-alanine N-acetyltransferase [Beijerinckiaceae bacterium]|nr:ribosomal protein S18-alanine N-acetyltransferase [Beijerinckiaceae bacterium]
MFGLFTKSFGLFSNRASPAIRPLSAGHSQACAAIHAACFAFPWTANDIEALLAAPSTFGDGAFGAKANDLQGFILSRRAADEAEVLTIAVSPRKRGQGIASRLLEANLSLLATKGVKSLFLEVEAENQAALALYAHFGFETVGERKSYYRKAGGETALAYIMRRPIG